MWICASCGEEHNGNFDACWHCGTSGGRTESSFDVLGWTRSGFDNALSVRFDVQEISQLKAMECFACELVSR